MASLPDTGFERFPNNPIEKKFYGRLQVENAFAQYYFNKESLIQHLIHEVKYKNKEDLGIQLGKMMGSAIKYSDRFSPDLLVPLPLSPARERKRGYNQSVLLCRGIESIIRIPTITNVVTRPLFTESQTSKGRIERWKNMEGKFVLSDPQPVKGKHILLVDDVITTGATLEACGSELLKAGDIQLSIACLCYSSR
jgi:ComF family protein